MKFLCLGYLDEEAFSTVPEEERNALLKVCLEQCIPFRATGKVREEEMVLASSHAKSIRPKNGRPVVTDGPFIETKEQIGAFFIIEADSIEEAIEVVSLHPGALMGEQHGFGIEIRPF
jgi:hypothetical protein